MINGQLACLGSNLHLKSKYGKGYQLDLKYDHKKLKIVDRIFDVLQEQEEEKKHGNDANDDIELDEMNKKQQSSDTYIAITTEELLKIFGADNVMLMENYTHYARYQVGTDEMSIADVFEHMEAIKAKCDIVNYAVSQISLEQIFLGFAKEQRPEEAEKEESGATNKKDDRSLCDKLTVGCLGAFVIG